MTKPDYKALADSVVISEESLKVINNAIKNYSGDVSILENAIGAYIMAHYMGIEPLRIMHSPPSLRKWAAVLGIDWAESFPDRGPLAGRSKGYQFALKIDAFKAAVYGGVSVPERRQMLNI